MMKHQSFNVKLNMYQLWINAVIIILVGRLSICIAVVWSSRLIYCFTFIKFLKELKKKKNSLNIMFNFIPFFWIEKDQTLYSNVLVKKLSWLMSAKLFDCQSVWPVLKYWQRWRLINKLLLTNFTNTHNLNGGWNIKVGDD